VQFKPPSCALCAAIPGIGITSRMTKIPPLAGRRVQPVYMGPERRRVPRFPFTGTADIILESSGARTSARMREISLYGCRLETTTKLPANAHVLLRIFGPKEFIEVTASVIFASLDLGTGLAFRKIEPDFEYVLKRWLRHALESELA